MKKLLFTLLLCLITTSAFAQPFAPQQKPMLGLQVNWAQSISHGLVYVGLFNENAGNKVFDLSGNRNTGTFDATNPPVWTSGKFGSTLSINTSATRPIVLSSSITLTKGTIAGWMYWDGSVNSGWIGDNTVENYFFYSATSWGINGSTTYYAFSDALPSAGWYFVVFTLDGTYFNLYIDCKPDSANPVSTTDTFTIDQIGSGYPSTTYVWKGSISSVLIFNRVLSASEISQLYQEQFCIFKPSWDWMLYGAISVPAAGQVIFITN